VIGWALAAYGFLGLAGAAAYASSSEMARLTHAVLGETTGRDVVYAAVASALYATCGVAMLRGARWSRVAYLLGTPAGYLAYWVFVRIAWVDATVSVGLYLVPLWYLTRPAAGAYFTGLTEPVTRRPDRPVVRAPASKAAPLVLVAGALLALSLTHTAAVIAYMVIRLRGGGVGSLAGPVFVTACLMLGPVALVSWGARLWAPDRPRLPFGVTLAATGAAAVANSLALTSQTGGIVREAMQTRLPLPEGVNPHHAVAAALLATGAMCLPAGVALAVWQTILDRRGGRLDAGDVE
jgi:hypothetical protein